MMQSHAPQVLNDPALDTAEPAVEQENATMYSESSSYMPRSRHFACLYTHQKTQKRKVWQDGRLVLQGSRAALHSAHIVPGSSDPVLDQCDVSAADATAIAAGRVTDLEMDKFLVTIDGPWVSKTNNSESKLPLASASASMQKLLTKKYRKPAQQIPPPRSTASQDPSRKRQRPLQPGELQKKYYGHLEPSNGDHRQAVSITQDGGANSDMSSSRGVPQDYLPPQPSMHTNRSALAEGNTFASPQPHSEQAGGRQLVNREQNHHLPAKSSTTNEISDNSGYNPNSFYGEEEEEEEEEQGSDDELSPDLFQIPQGQNGTFQAPPAFGFNNLLQVPEPNGEANPFQVPESRPVVSSMPSDTSMSKLTSETTEHHGSTLSTSQLLDLFGAGGPADFTASTNQENGTSSQLDSLEKEASVGGSQTPAVSSNELDLQIEDEFQLPSDDSSSDDDEDE